MPETATAASLPTTRPRFSLAVNIYLWGFSAVLGLSPVGLLLARGNRTKVAAAWWASSLAWPLLLALLFGYALRRCSSDKLHFTDGLLWIVRSMMTGWTTQSFILIPPLCPPPSSAPS